MLLSSFCLFYNHVKAQNSSDCTLVFKHDSTVYESYEVAVIPHAIDSICLFDRLCKTNFPDTVLTSTRLLFEFVVLKNGTVTGFRIISCANPSVAESVANVINDIRWTPGLIDGKAVNTRMRQQLYIDFQK